jgi:hypothetical protein
MHTSLFHSELNLPFAVDSDFIIINPQYEYFVYKQNENNFKFQSINTSIVWQHTWNNKKWQTAFVIIAKSIAQENIFLKKNSFQAGGAVLFTYRARQNLKYKAGVYGNSEFFGPFFVPLLGIDWNLSDRFNFFGVLPSNINIEYKFIPKKIHGLLSFASSTTSYRLGERQYLRLNDYQLKADVDYYLTKNHVLSLDVGHSIFRDYSFGERRNGETKTLQSTFQNNFLIRVTYSFRIRTDV